MPELEKKLQDYFPSLEGIYTDLDSRGYWSNLNQEDQQALMTLVKTKGCLAAIKEKFPQYENMIFDPARAAGLRLLDINEDETGVDYGCMWGNLLVYAAKNAKVMVGIDQTRDSLRFLQHRLQEEKLSNCFLVNSNLKKRLNFKDCFDFAIVNGVMEWIPEEGNVELKRFFKKGGGRFKKPGKDPRTLQLEFLRMVFDNLNEKGRLYLGIENRFDYQYFLWKKDPHSDLMYTAFLPRAAANLISNICYGRPYLNYLYSRKALAELLRESGFKKIDIYAVFPDYRFPRKIILMENRFSCQYEPVYDPGMSKNKFKMIVKKSRKFPDLLIYKKLKLFGLAPSFIAIARKV